MCCIDKKEHDNNRLAMDEEDVTDPERVTTEQFLHCDDSTSEEQRKPMGYHMSQQQHQDDQHFIYTDLSNTNVIVSDHGGSTQTGSTTADNALYAQLNTIYKPSIYSQPETPMKATPSVPSAEGAEESDLPQYDVIPTIKVTPTTATDDDTTYANTTNKQEHIKGEVFLYAVPKKNKLKLNLQPSQ